MLSTGVEEKMSVTKIFFALFLISSGINFCVGSLLVRSKPGIIRGSLLKTRSDQDIYSFRGIPYAEAPVGKFRFKPPVPKRRWNGVLNATEDGPICMQNSYPELNRSENCLVLNVYTRNVKKLRPVMVFIHGGALLMDTCRSDLYGPEYLLEHDVVLVALNYRLGVWGFLTTNTADAPGNLGFKDQVLALKWVRENIRMFGGNPRQVTLFGQSAGGVSVGAHLISPMSKNLFHRAILMSGSPTELIPPLNYNNTRKIAEYVGCPLNNSLVNCLRFTSNDKLLEASQHLDEFGIDPARKWNVVVEKNFGQKRFMTADPNSLMVAGKFHKVPILGGYVAGEYVQRAYYILSRSNLLQEFNDNRYKTNPISLLYPRDEEWSRNITDRLRIAYVNGTDFTNNNFRQMGILFGDAVVRFRLKKFLERASQFTKVYVYSNSYLGRYSQFYYPDDKPYTMVHSDDLQYIFYRKNWFAPLYSKDDKENFMVQQLTRVFVNFAIEEVPFKNRSNVWLPWNKKRHQIYELSGDQSPKEFEQFIGVWYELFPGP